MKVLRVIVAVLVVADVLCAGLLPVFGCEEKGESGLYVDPQPVTIAGHDGNAIEPFISPDGQFLFFNNENDSKVKTNLLLRDAPAQTAFAISGNCGGRELAFARCGAECRRSGALLFHLSA